MDFQKEVLDSKELILVDFYSDSCYPCKMMNPIIDELEKKVKVIKVNIMEQPEFVNNYRVYAVPTFIFFKNGEIVQKFIGAQKKENLEDIIDSMK